MFSSEPGRRIFCGCSVGWTNGRAGGWRCGWAWVCSWTAIGGAVGRVAAASLTAAWKNAAAREPPAAADPCAEAGLCGTAGRPVGRIVLMNATLSWLMQGRRAWSTRG
jgi:hypothetical protein